MQKRSKLLIGGLSTAAVVTGVALTGGTSAYYFDLETSNGNKISACSFDLIADEKPVVAKGAGTDGNVQVTGPVAPGNTADVNGKWGGVMVGGLYRVTIGDMEPGDKYTVTIPLSNSGPCTGELWGDIRGPFNDNENLPNSEAENSWQTYHHDPDLLGVGDEESTAIQNQQPTSGLTPALIDEYDGGAGDLDNLVNVTYGPDDANNSVTESFSEFAWRKPTMLDPHFDSPKNVNVELEVPLGAVGEGNEIMGDSFEFLIDFALIQQGKIDQYTADNLNNSHMNDPQP